MTRCGTVAFLGRPNAGKSTLLNALVGSRLAIVSPRAQSTRTPVVGLITRGDTQAILLDTPGLLDPGYALHRAMQASIGESVASADVVVHLIDATRPDPSALGSALASLGVVVPPGRVVEAWNKVDAPDAVAELPAGAIGLSAKTGEGIDALWERMRELLPLGDFRHAEDDLSTQPMRFFVSEAIREVAFEQLREELPYAIHAEVEEFREGSSPTYIRVTMYVERDSQKGIVVGKGGVQLRALGTAARARLEPLVGGPVYLDLWVKVLKDWRRDVPTLRRLGFHVPDDVP
jgi:GTP-binding protein Era